MKRIYDNCCGIDVHKKLLVACFIHGNKQEIREFGTTVDLSDRIAVLENGTVADCGSHAELMERCAAYRDIYSSQIKQTEEVACNE